MYEDMTGWKDDISNIRRFDGLPLTTRAYINRLQEISQIPISIISVGYERGAHIMLKDPFA